MRMPKLEPDDGIPWLDPDKLTTCLSGCQDAAAVDGHHQDGEEQTALAQGPGLSLQAISSGVFHTIHVTTPSCGIMAGKVSDPNSCLGKTIAKHEEKLVRHAPPRMQALLSAAGMRKLWQQDG